MTEKRSIFVLKVKVLENLKFKMKTKKGVSGVISMLLIVLLVFVAVGILWATISSLIKNKTGESESCFGNFGKMEINSKYTCYNSSSNETVFSIERKDIDLDELLISISSEGQSHSIELLITSRDDLEELTNNKRLDDVILPKKNSGSIYYLNMNMISFQTKPTSIKIAPVINGHQCEVIDTLNIIEDCEALL